MAYFVARSALPRRGRPLVWAVVVGLLTGADLLKPRSLDFTILDPKLFAVVVFIFLPSVAAFLIAVTLERLLLLAPWSNRMLAVVLALGALPLLTVLPALLLVAGAALLLRRRPRMSALVLAGAKAAVPVALATLAVVSGIELWQDADAILH